jgi:hypothetical protein
MIIDFQLVTSKSTLHVYMFSYPSVYVLRGLSIKFSAKNVCSDMLLSTISEIFFFAIEFSITKFALLECCFEFI